jgi:uncharacterized membrane protein YcfT
MSSFSTPRLNSSAASRVGWVDIAKGLCIIFVVMMHIVGGFERATGDAGWLGTLVEFAQPVRMPAFFLISGLFLARTIDKDWRDYLDKKVLHFAYFYVLWLTIQFAFRGPALVGEIGAEATVLSYFQAFFVPYDTLWFIYMLPIFFVVTKLFRNVPPMLFLAAVALVEVLPIETGHWLFDEFCRRYVYFVAGYVLARQVFAFADGARSRAGLTLAVLLLWGLANGAVVFLTGFSMAPGVTLVLGAAGAAAVVAMASLMKESGAFGWLAYVGKNSIVVYLSFFLPMIVMRMLLLRFGGPLDPGTMALISLCVAVAGPIVGHWLVRGTPLRFLFERPQWAHLRSGTQARAVPAE